VRRRSELESFQTSADLPVLRNGIAGGSANARRRDRDCRTRSRGRITIDSRRSARMAGRQEIGPLPELPGNFGLRPCESRAALRLLWLGAACSVRTGQGRLPARITAAAENLRTAGAGSDPQLVQ